MRRVWAWVYVWQILFCTALHGQTDTVYARNVLPAQVRTDRMAIQYLKTDHIADAVNLFDSTLSYNLRSVIVNQMSEIASVIKFHGTLHKDSVLTFKTPAGLHIYTVTYTCYVDEQPYYSFSFYFNSTGDTTLIKYATTKHYSIITNGKHKKAVETKPKKEHQPVKPPPSMGGM